tara:strand:+ start:355 stop:564 length:210 start_codon:yes stop_codon:yes gene_type:complete
MDRIEKLISDSGRASLTLGNVLIAAYNVAKENEDKMLAKMLIEVLGKKNDFDKTMIKLIEYLEKRKDME